MFLKIVAVAAQSVLTFFKWDAVKKHKHQVTLENNVWSKHWKVPSWSF